MREAIRRYGVRQRFVSDIATAQVVKGLDIEHAYSLTHARGGSAEPSSGDPRQTPHG
jgi:hypothetical protein